MLASQQVQWEENLRAISRERQAQAERAVDLERRLAAERARAVAANEQFHQDLKRQEQELAARHAALERMRADVGKAQQEALEVRLATEELWARLCGTMAPAALAQSLTQTRLKLAEELRLQKSELAAQRDEIKTLAARVGETYQKLAAEREETQAWTNARRREIEQQAALLAKREEQLHHERAELRQQAAAWQIERFGLEQEIRRLLQQPDGPDNWAAA